MSHPCEGVEEPGRPWKKPAFPHRYLDSLCTFLKVPFQVFAPVSVFSPFRELICFNDVCFLLASSTSTPPTLPSPPTLDLVLSLSLYIGRDCKTSIEGAGLGRVKDVRCLQVKRNFLMAS